VTSASLDAAVRYVTRVPSDVSPPAPSQAGGAEDAEDAAEALSFEAVYDRCFDFVWRNLRRLGVPDAHLDDAAQEVFLVVHRRLPELQKQGSVRQWLFAILLRVASDHRRSIRRKSPHNLATGAPIEADSIADDRSQSPDERTAQAEGVRLLYKLLEELDDEKRAVFVLAELEQMSAPEIAAALSVNLNTVYARLRAARREFEHAVQREKARDEWRLR
jgi:RNA polymerase sigma-70 factor (ECF subfamily)